MIIARTGVGYDQITWTRHRARRGRVHLGRLQQEAWRTPPGRSDGVARRIPEFDQRCAGRLVPADRRRRVRQIIASSAPEASARAWPAGAGFDMTVLAYDIYQDEDSPSSTTCSTSRWTNCWPARSRLHARLPQQETQGMVNEDFLRKMKPPRTS